MWYRSGGEVSTVPFAKWKAVKTGGARLRTSAVHTPAFAVTPAADRHRVANLASDQYDFDLCKNVLRSTLRLRATSGCQLNANRLLVGLFLHVRPNYIHSASNDIHTDGPGLRLGARARARARARG